MDSENIAPAKTTARFVSDYKQILFSKRSGCLWACLALSVAAYAGMKLAWNAGEGNSFVGYLAVICGYSALCLGSVSLLFFTMPILAYIILPLLSGVLTVAVEIGKALIRELDRLSKKMMWNSDDQ